MSERDEMIERIKPQCDAWNMSAPEFDPRNFPEMIADICAAEIVRELEALRRARPPCFTGSDEREEWCIAIDARLAALRGTVQSEVAAGRRAPERVENAQADLPAPASSLRDFVGDDGMKALAPLIRERPLSDADVLDRAAKILRDARPAISSLLSSDAKACRAASDKPAPDWIERMVKDWLDGPDVSIAKVIRERLEPVVERLEHVAENTGATWVQLDIERALSLLRGEARP